jgi:hypothetical protein
LISKGLQFDAIYVDGSHDYIDVYMDIVLSSAVAAKGALIFGDDFQEPDVADAVKDFCADTNQQFQTHSKGRGQRNYWMIQPKA